MTYDIIDLGLIDFREAYIFQKECAAKVKAKTSAGFIIFAEHLPVFTLGRFAKAHNLLVDEQALRQKGIGLVKTDRGGDITFHGPGQLIAYPIIDLNKGHRDIHRFLHGLEEVIIKSLSEFGISSFRSRGRTGVWTENGKVASIGIGVSRWVTYHGLAINANVDLSYFSMINPCGFTDIKVTSMKEMLGSKVDIAALKASVKKHFS